MPRKTTSPDILSLRVPVLTRYTGDPFYRFLGLRDYGTIVKLREVFSRVLGLRDALVDYVRLEISLGMHDTPTTKFETTDIFGSNLSVRVTEPELQIAWKIVWKVGKYFENPEPALHDILKATLDLRLARHLDTTRVRSYVVSAGEPRRVLENSERNLSMLRERGLSMWSGHHYTLLRKTRTLEEVVNEAREIVHSVLTQETAKQ